MVWRLPSVTGTGCFGVAIGKADINHTKQHVAEQISLSMPGL